MSKEAKIAIYRPGRFGTALAVPLSENTEVILIFGSREANAAFQHTRENPKYHPGHKLPDSVKSTDNIQKGLRDANILLLATPVPHLRTTYELLMPYAKDRLVVCGSKGIEAVTCKTPSQILKDINPKLNGSYAAISGPNLAWEIIRKLPAEIVIASKNESIRQKLKRILRTSYLFPYETSDVTGVELGGALKNPVAMLVGICDGLGLGNNAAAAIQNRGWREATRLAVVAGADEWTLTGLAGAADLAVSTRKDGGGRNYGAGVDIGRGEDPRLLQQSERTMEAFNTIAPAVALAHDKGVDVPLLEGLLQIINRERRPNHVISLLIDGNNHYEDPQPIIDRRLRLPLRILNRLSHRWRSAT